jgi:peptide/nickel transport system ATP-binding protein/oligopeptide transport system ATP-binding protein
MIAMALSCEPRVLIADEPTTALDVTIQAQILDLLKELQAKTGMALILITHDLGVVAEVADDVVVMYAGQVAEQGSVREIFKSPRHPYTRGLLNSIPTLSKDPTGKVKRERLETIPGIVPNLLHLPRGCRFQERCVHVVDSCRQEEPVLRNPGGGTHRVRCPFEIGDFGRARS